jgi:hypothetical protein
MSRYLVWHGRQCRGPFDRTRVAANYAKGALGAWDLVWTEGMVNWALVSRLFGPPASQ